MLGTNLKILVDKDGATYRQQTATELYVVLDDGDAEAQSPWLCLRTRHFGRMRNKEYEAVWTH